MKAVLFFLLPALIALSPYIARVYSEDFYTQHIYSEGGIIENLTVVLLVIAVVLGTLSLKRIYKVEKLSPIFFWVLVITLGCFYFAGEEASWGQHLFHWKTPELMKELNNQGETNLHNTSGLFDQVPRTILTIMVFIGGVLLPIVNKSKQFFSSITPDIAILPTALLAVLISFPRKIARIYKEALDPQLFSTLNIGSGESKECLLALFLMLYLLILFKRREIK